jgi:hypothetical protein
VDSRKYVLAVVLNQGSAEKTREEKGHNANWTDINGNQTMDPVRKQLEEDGRKTALQSIGQTDKGNWNKEL